MTRHAGKMGKSLKNAVSPDDIYEAYGADTLRMYEMAMWPWTSTVPGGLTTSWACSASCSSSARNVIDETTGQAHVSEAVERGKDEPLYRLLHQTIDAVGSQYGELRYNVAIARLTELNNAVTRHVRPWRRPPRRRRTAGAHGGAPGAAHRRRALGAAGAG